MKLAFLFGTMSRGGAERVIASLANTYCKRGDLIHIITLDNGQSGYPLDDRVMHIKLNLAGQSANKVQGLMRNIKVIQALHKQISTEQYDAVITFELRLAVLLQYAFPFGRKFKLITSERANPNKRRLRRFEKMQYDLLLPRVDGFIFQTERVSRCYPERLRQIGCVIHNGVFSEILPAGIVPLSERRQKEICAIGRLADQKGYDLLLNAFAQFHVTHCEHHLHIYGKGALQPKIEEQIVQLGLTDCVSLHGSVPNVMFEVADMGMFVMASRFEGMPNALMEAMACGLPCVSSDCDFGPGELIRDHENGLLVPVENVEGLVNAMTEIADDHVLAAKLSANAVEIRVTHNGEKISDQYYQYIADVVAKE